MNLNTEPAVFVQENAAVLSVAAALLIVTGVGVSQTSLVPGLASISGLDSQLCAVSADQVRISSNDPNIGGKTWVVDAVATCSDHVIEGGALVEAEDVKGRDSSTGDTAKAREDFEIGVTDLQGYAYNNIRDSSTLKTYKVEHDVIAGSGVAGGIVKSDLQDCREWQEDNSVSLYALDQPDIDRGDDQYSNSDWRSYKESTGITSAKLHCYRAKNKEGEVGKLESTSYSDWTATFKMRADGETKSKTVTKGQADGGVTLGSGDRKAHIQYKGSLTSGILDINLDTNRFRPACDNNCNQPENQKSYKITTDGLTQDYVDSLNSFEQNAENAINNGDADSVVTSHNQDVNNIYIDQSDALKKSVGRWIDRTEFNAGQFRIYSEDSDTLGNPSFTFRVGAGWIGFGIPVAEPEIQSASDVSIDALGPGSSTRITVENTADVSGSVHASVSCPSPLQAGYEESYIRAGGTTAYNVNIESGPSPDNTYTCDVLVKDKDSRTTQDSTTIDVEVAASCTNTDGDARCDQNDACVDRPGPESNEGCPTGPNDSDSDGVHDGLDQCPTRSQTPQSKLRRFDTSQEIYNGYQDGDGCPDEIQNPNEEVQCNDGLDNDGDGLIDNADPDCEEPSSTPWPLIIGGILSTLLVGGAIYYYRKPLKKRVANFGAGQ